jgi:hypothetical protein
VSGKVYLVRFKEGREVESAKWLTEKLEEIENGAGSKSLATGRGDERTAPSGIRCRRGATVSQENRRQLT